MIISNLENEGYIGTTTEYMNGVVFEDGVIQYYTNETGRVLKVTGGYETQYVINDHLGNARMTLKADVNNEPVVLQYDSYYPFGLEMGGMSFVSGTTENKYKYNGKELQTAHNLGWYDYGARFYDPQLGRWHVVDPLAEFNFSMNPYHYVSCNPINRFDPNGLTDYEFNKKTGKIKVVEGTQDDGPDRIIKGKAKYDENGNLKNRSGKVQQLEGKIENLKNGTGIDGDGEFEYQTYTFTNSTDADKAYSFMGNETNVEIAKWGLVGGDGKSETRFFTSGDTKTIRGEVLFLIMEKTKDPGLKLLSHMHNHGNPETGYMGKFGPSPEDKKFAESISKTLFTNQSIATKFYVWRYGNVTQYDQNGVVKK